MVRARPHVRVSLFMPYGLTARTAVQGHTAHVGYDGSQSMYGYLKYASCSNSWPCPPCNAAISLQVLWLHPIRYLF